MVQDPGKAVPGSPAAKQEQPPGKDAPPKTLLPTATAPAKAGGGLLGQTPGKNEPGKTTPVATGPQPTAPLGTAPVGTAPLGTVPQATVPEAPRAVPLQSPPPPVAGVAAPAQPEGFRIGTILFPALWLIGVLVIGAIILALLKRSREKSALAATTTASDQLATFRHAYEEGEMTPEEFQKVKARLSEKLRERDPMSMPPQARQRRDGEMGLAGDENA